MVWLYFVVFYLPADVLRSAASTALITSPSSEALRFTQYDSRNNGDDSRANGADSHKQTVTLCNMFLSL